MRDYQEKWLEHAMIAELRRELAVERERAEMGWRGLQNIYSAIEGRECDQEVALGMATSSIVRLKERAERAEAASAAREVNHRMLIARLGDQIEQIATLTAERDQALLERDGMEALSAATGPRTRVAASETNSASQVDQALERGKSPESASARPIPATYPCPECGMARQLGE